MKAFDFAGHVWPTVYGLESPVVDHFAFTSKVSIGSCLLCPEPQSNGSQDKTMEY